MKMKVILVMDFGMEMIDGENCKGEMLLRWGLGFFICGGVRLSW